MTKGFPSQARQNLGIGNDPTFQPTPNLRNQSMLQEAEQFSNHLKRVEKEIRTVKTATEGTSKSSSALRGPGLSWTCAKTFILREFPAAEMPIGLFEHTHW
jgi:hypothetical protein